MKKINKTEFIIGIVILAAVLLAGAVFLKGSSLFYRMLVGLGLGYALTRAMF